MASVFYVLVGISIVACIRAAPTANAPDLAEKLNQFVTLVDNGFRSIALTLRELRSNQAIDHKTVMKLTFDKLNKSVSDLQGIGKCPTSWKQFDGYCYKFVAMTAGVADNALAACKSLGATLTRVRSAKHQTFLQSGLSGKHVIVGGNDRDTEGTWMWSDGVLIKDGGYINWASGEPSGGDSQDCMYVHNTNGKWYDLTCSTNYGRNWGYVCEKLLR